MLIVNSIQGTTLEDGHNPVTNQRGILRYHTWPYDEDDLDPGFEDTIIISDEPIPEESFDGTRYTLFTENHKRNELVIGGQRCKSSFFPHSSIY